LSAVERKKDPLSEFLTLSLCTFQVLLTQKFSAASDVWAYGIMLYELWSNGEQPYRFMNNHQVSIEVGNGYRLNCPKGCPENVYKLMLSW
jgi:serine/threonine protein kinase